MAVIKMPLGTWMVVDRGASALTIVSTHSAQAEAEAERDRRNRHTDGKRYNALIALQPVAHGMGCACE
jgi:hypothetical protein